MQEINKLIFKDTAAKIHFVHHNRDYFNINTENHTRFVTSVK